MVCRSNPGRASSFFFFFHSLSILFPYQYTTAPSTLPQLPHVMGLLGRLYGCLTSLHPRKIYRRLRRLTDRKLLILCNCFILLCSLYQTICGFAIVLAFTYDFGRVMQGLGKQEERTTGISTYLTQAIIGIYMLITSIIGLHSSRKVDIRLLIAYYWMTLIGIGPLFLFSIACINFKDVLRGWIDHRWDTSEFVLMRKFFCDEGTSDRECTVPMNGGHEFADEAAWCQNHYEQSNCEQIREVSDCAPLISWTVPNSTHFFLFLFNISPT